MSFFQSQPNGTVEVDSWYIKWCAKRINYVQIVYSKFGALIPLRYIKGVVNDIFNNIIMVKQIEY